MDKLDKIFLSFLKTHLNAPKDVQFEFEPESDTDWIIVTVLVDASKMDKNGPNYNEEYSKFFIRPERKESGFFIYDWESKYNNALKSFMKYTGMSYNNKKYRFHNRIVNYDYLNGVGDKIEDGIKKTSYPETTIEFTKNSEPDISLVFRLKDPLSYYDFIKELREILGNSVSLDSYHIGWGQLS